MKDLISYLDDLKDKCGSDYKAAKMLGISKVTISTLRTRKQLSDDLAIKIADILNIEPSEILLAGAIARSEGRVKEAWLKTSNIIKNIHYAKLKKAAGHGMTRLLSFLGIKSYGQKEEIEFLSRSLERRKTERRKSRRDISCFG